MSHRRYTVAVVLAPAISAAALLFVPSRLAAALQAVVTGTDTTGALALFGATLLVLLCADFAGTLATGSYVALGTVETRRRVARSALTEPALAGGAADQVTRILVDARQPAARLPLLTAVSLAVINLVAALVLLALIDWTLVVGVVGGLLVIVVLLRRLVDDLSVLVQRYRRAQADVGQRLLDAQTGAVTIRAYGTWRRELARVLDAQPAVRDAGESLWSAQGRFAWRSAVVVPALLLVSVAVGGWSLSSGRIDISGYVAAIAYTYLVISSLDGVEAAAGLGAVRAAQARLAGLRTPAASHTPLGPRPEPRPLAATLSDVTVVDAQGATVLDDVNLEIPPGAFVAITGAAGSGRSALAAVFSGSTVPSAGSALIDGRPAHERDADGYRRGVLGHARPAMLGEDIDGLITFDVDAGDAPRLAEQARLDDVVRALPAGYATLIRDLPLSGGELQRLAIAQALARDSGLLVLDDVTSSLDPATEREVLGALLAARDKRTLIVVTNREAVLARADRVIRLDSGRVVEQVGAPA